MLAGKKFLAVVPARGGSKGVPRKNIRMFCGRPLLALTLEQAAGVPEIDRVVVSTDDAEIADLTRSAGGEVVERPSDLAGDAAPTEWALLHALDVLAGANEAFDYVMVLEPTSPLRSPDTIRRCMKEIIESGMESLVTVVETRSNIGRVQNGVFRPLAPGAPRRRQEREPFYVESSTVYICRTEYLRKTGSLVADDWQAVTVSDVEALDINTELDFTVAEALVLQMGRK
jgi:CMP-N,N'-diacetyllegionaminic acid synthase